MGTIRVNDDTILTLPSIFGISIQSIGIQLGFNKSPTTVSLTLVEDASKGQNFTLKSLSNNGMFSMQNINIGAIDEWFLVNSWNENQIDISGSGVFNVQLVDTKQVLNAINIGIETGDVKEINDLGNLVLTDNGGIDVVKKAVESQTFNFRGNKFQVRLNNIDQVDLIPTASQFLGLDSDTGSELVFIASPPIVRRSDIPPGKLGEFIRKNRTTSLSDIGDDSTLTSSSSTLTVDLGASPPTQPSSDIIVLSDYISSTASLNQSDWYVRTSKVNDIFIIDVIFIKRSVKIADDIGIDIDKISNDHVDRVIKKSIGFEGNEESNKNRIILGARKQTLRQFDISNVKAFFGFNPATDRPFNNIIDAVGDSRVSFELLNLVLDTEVNEINLINQKIKSPTFLLEDLLKFKLVFPLKSKVPVVLR